MKPADVVFPLAPVYERHGIEFRQAKAVALHPEGDAGDPAPFVVIESTRSGHEGNASSFATTSSSTPPVRN
jgi:sulfide:quinone oxidoreductase